MNDELGDVPEIPIGRKKRQSALQCVRSDPIVGIGQLDSGREKLRPKPTVNRRSICLGVQHLK